MFVKGKDICTGFCYDIVRELQRYQDLEFYMLAVICWARYEQIEGSIKYFDPDV